MDFLLVALAGGLLGFGISFTSLWYGHCSTAPAVWPLHHLRLHLVSLPIPSSLILESLSLDLSLSKVHVPLHSHRVQPNRLTEQDHRGSGGDHPL